MHPIPKEDQEHKLEITFAISDETLIGTRMIHDFGKSWGNIFHSHPFIAKVDGANDDDGDDDGDDDDDDDDADGNDDDNGDDGNNDDDDDDDDDDACMISTGMIHDSGKSGHEGFLIPIHTLPNSHGSQAY